MSSILYISSVYFWMTKVYTSKSQLSIQNAAISSLQVSVCALQENMCNQEEAVQCKEVMTRLLQDCLTGVGKFCGQPYYIQVYPCYPQIHSPARSVLIHQEAAFKKQLKGMKAVGVLKPDDHTTPRINSYYWEERHARTTQTENLSRPFQSQQASAREPFYFTRQMSTDVDFPRDAGT